MGIGECDERVIYFQHTLFRGTYAGVAEQIDKTGLERPNSVETMFLIYPAYKNPRGIYSQKILKILKDKFLWEFTGEYYLPKSNEEINNGVLLDLDSQNLKFENGKLVMDKNSLIERLKNNDKYVRFVPFGYKTGSQTWQELEKNKYVQERYGERGAEKIAEVASRYKQNPSIWSYVLDKEKIITPLIYIGKDFGNKICIYGNFVGLDKIEGCAFGIKK